MARNINSVVIQLNGVEEICVTIFCVSHRLWYGDLHHLGNLVAQKSQEMAYEYEPQVKAKCSRNKRFVLSFIITILFVHFDIWLNQTNI